MQGGDIEEASTRKAPTSNTYDQERAVLLAYIQDFARALGDEASVTASTTRAVNLYRQSGLALEAFVEQLYAARQVTKERTAAIKGRPKADGQGDAPKNTLADSFAVVEGLIGLHAERSSRGPWVPHHPSSRPG